MKGICLITKEAADMSLIQGQQYYEGYFLKKIVYDIEEGVFDIEGITEKSGNSDIETKLRECEALYISENLCGKYEYLFDIARQSGIEVLNNEGKTFLPEGTFDVEIPLIAIISTFSEAHRVRAVESIVKQFEMQNVHVVVFSNDKYCRVYGYEYINTELSNNDFNEFCRIIKKKVSKGIVEKKADLAIFEFTGAWNNSYCEEDKNVSFAVYAIRKAVGIDYAAVIIPYNLCEDSSVFSAVEKECLHDAGTIDAFIVDNVICDCNGDNHMAEKQSEAIEIDLCAEVPETVKNYDGIVPVISIKNCAEELIKSIVESLTYDEDDIVVL